MRECTVEPLWAVVSARGSGERHVAHDHGGNTSKRSRTADGATAMRRRCERSDAGRSERHIACIRRIPSNTCITALHRTLSTSVAHPADDLVLHVHAKSIHARHPHTRVST